MHRYESNARPLGRIQLGAIIVAVIGIVLSLFGAIADLDRFFQSYLVAYVYWLEIALGCLGLLLLVSAVHGAWGLATQRILAAGARTLPLMAVLFVPILFALGRLFPWAGHADGDYHAVPYLDVTFVLVRAVIYFVVWILLAYLVSGWLYAHDRSADHRLLGRARALGYFGLILFILTSSGAALDWQLSLDPSFFSSVYGWLSNARQAIGAFALCIVLLALIWSPEELTRLFRRPIFNDLGTLLTAAVLVYTYMEFIQGLITWYANLAYEAPWYIARIQGGWRWFVIFLAVFHFFIPFFLLIMPGFKRKISQLAAVALLLTVMRYAGLYWIVMPEFYSSVALSWIDLALWLAIGGLWTLAFVWLLRLHPLLPINNPRLIPPEVLGESHTEAFGATGAD